MGARREIRDTFWAMLEARPEVTAAFRPNSRIKEGQRGNAAKHSLRDPNAFPKLEISDGRAVHSAFADGRTFAMEDAEFLDSDGDWVVHRTYVYVFTITSRTLEGGDLDDAEDITQCALLTGGPRMGLDFVTQLGPMTGKPRTVVEGKLTTSFEVSVTTEVSGRDLIPT